MEPPFRAVGRSASFRGLYGGRRPILAVQLGAGGGQEYIVYRYVSMCVQLSNICLPISMCTYIYIHIYNIIYIYIFMCLCVDWNIFVHWRIHVCSYLTRQGLGWLDASAGTVENVPLDGFKRMKNVEFIQFTHKKRAYDLIWPMKLVVSIPIYIYTYVCLFSTNSGRTFESDCKGCDGVAELLIQNRWWLKLTKIADTHRIFTSSTCFFGCQK